MGRRDVAASPRSRAVSCRAGRRTAASSVSPPRAAGRTGRRWPPTARCTSPRTAGWADGPRTTPGIQRVTPDGDVDDGRHRGRRPDARRSQRPRLRRRRPAVVHRSARRSDDPARNDRPGRMFAVDPSTGEGELVVELGPVFPNGIAFLADGTLVWTESFTRRVMATGRRRARARRSSCPSATSPTGCASAPTAACTWPSTYAHCVSVVDGRRDRRPLHVRRRDGDELLLRRDRPLRHRVPPRHAVALPARRRGLRRSAR